MKIGMDERKYSDALQKADVLLRWYPDNLLYAYYRFHILLKLDRKPEALTVLTAIRMKGRQNSSLNEAQKKHFLDLAQKDLEQYYRKNPN
jgi:predicted Zn-dependent protease